MMNKFVASVIAVLLIGLALVSAQVTVTPASGTVSGLPGEVSDTKVFVVENLGSESVDLSISAVDLVGQSDATKKILASQVVISPNSFTLAPSGQNGDEQSVNVGVNIPKGLPVQFYKGTFKIRERANEVASFDLLANILAKDDIELIVTSPLKVSGQERDTRTVGFQIRNDGSTSIQLNDRANEIDSTFSFLQSSFSDGDEDITLTFDITDENLAPGEITNVNLRIEIPNNIEIDTYSGDITVRGGADSATFRLEINVHPELCKDGPIGDLDVTIQEPDNGDEFAPGDIMNIEIDVENNGDREIKDVVVETFFYNVDADEEIERVESDPEDIDKRDDQTYELEIELPFDGDITEDDEYVLFVKAFEDGDEDRHCAEAQITIQIEREKHDVRVMDISLLPASAEPGASVDVSVKVINVGSSDEDDVTVRASLPELGWDQTSSPVDLDDGESSDNDATLRFSFTVPDNTVAKAYSLEATVTFDDGDDRNSEFGTFTVLEATTRAPTTPPPRDVFRVQSVSDAGNNAFIVSTIVTNEGTDTRSFEIELLASWATPVTKQIVILSPGDSRNVQFNVNANQGLQAGRYTGTISVREDGVLVDSKTFNAEIKQRATTQPITGFNIANLFGGDSGAVIWILVDIVLVIVAIFFIKLIFTSGKKKAVQVRSQQPAATVQKVKL